eukprot:CAMPEP_0119037676 /NCGR_PEP_ID=MMETSP1177-20130426/6174_1 /TAXON_ID=2985 /ORGANISM="Ochromonas sp, Strain CCMP1899" /LENGTH=455 /DNA_ID=CAMNT_0006999277 /DNA_START=177 /DNA_END=1544 /DNA_ORIENTATION=-
MSSNSGIDNDRAASTCDGGLLFGIDDIKEANFYSDHIALNSSRILVEDVKYIYNLFLHNAGGNITKLEETVKNMNDKISKFKVSDEVWDRNEFTTVIESIIAGVGKFIFVLAGKTAGKSLLFRSLEKQFPMKVFMLNLQTKPNILKGLLSTLRKRQWADDDTQERIKKMILNASSAVIKEAIPEDFGVNAENIENLFGLAAGESDSIETLSNLIDELVAGLGEITLVIDEADVAFKISPDASQDEIKAAKEALALFTTLTKSQNKVNVILVSSEHAFPYQLRDSKLDFNLANCNGYVYAGEVPPKDMYELLTVEWGVDSNIALALINLYGGHIYDMMIALERLQLEKEEFNWFFDSNLSDDVQQCLECKFEKDEDNIRMRDTLRQLALTGFVPLKSIRDVIAMKISENNVGGVVKVAGTIVGLRKEVWEQTKFKNGIVPTKQSMRLVIAEVLENE